MSSEDMFELRSCCIRAFRSAVAAVQPYERVRSSLKIVDDSLTVGKRTYKLNHNVHLVAFGKAALGMVQGAERVLSNHIVQGIASVPRKTLQKLAPGSHLKTQLFEGATNNLPDEDSCSTARKIEDMARSLTANDLFLVMISGGGSALLPAPLDSISLTEKLETIKAMTCRGADIKQLNIVRIALSRLKGGKLAIIAEPAKVISLIISDIVGDPIHLIASAPTVLIPHKIAVENNPITILRKLNAWNDVPKNVQDALQISTSSFKHDVDINNHIISNNETAVGGLVETLTEVGYACHKVSTTIAKDAQVFGNELSDIVKAVVTSNDPTEALNKLHWFDMNLKCPNKDKFALLFGGECTVTLKGTGKGGRNQEIVLKVLSELIGMDPQKFQYEFAVMSSGTDGQDGPTEAAGAVLTIKDLEYINENGSWDKAKIDAYLNKNDSYNFWKMFRDGACHVTTGPTGTNVMDVQVLLFKRK